MTEVPPNDIPKGGHILDVREPGEWQAEHIADSIHIPLGKLPGNPPLPSDEMIYVICATGVRSKSAAEDLRKKGYQAVNVQGGIEAWKSAGRPLERSQALSDAEYSRYARQIILPELGTEGQARLRAARVLLLGAGGLGSPTAFYLAAAGVGALGIVDDDVVDSSNLQRQILHTTQGVGEKKTLSARQRLEALNPDTKIEEHPYRITRDNILDILPQYDLVVDGTDNFPTRYLLNDAAQRVRKPVVSASILGWEGQISTFLPGGPCYRCLFPEPPPAELAPSCGVAGVLGTVAGTLGVLSANEAVKIIAEVGRTLSGRLLLFSALDTTWTELRVHRNPECPDCSQIKSGPFPDYVEWCSTAGRR